MKRFLPRLNKTRDAANEGAPTLNNRRIFSLPTLLLFAILAAFAYFLATRFDMDWRATFDNIRHINPWLYALGFAAYYLSFSVRGQRWRMLARNTGELDGLAQSRLPSMASSAAYIIIGWFVNSVTWLRLGDGYRAWLFARHSGGSFSWSLGVVVAERALDIAAMAILLLLAAGAALLAATAGGAAETALLVALITAGVVAAMICALLLMRVWGERAARFLPSRIEAEYHRFASGTLGSMKQLPSLTLAGVAGWLLEIARMYLVIEALGLSAPLSLIAITALCAAILSTVPIPGGVGFVEPGIVGLLLLSMGRQDAVSVALVDRSITFVSVIAIGAVIFLAVQIWQGRSARGKPPAAEGRA